MTLRHLGLATLLSGAALVVGTADAQSFERDPFGGLPEVVTRTAVRAPAIALSPVLEVALPGPLPGGGPWVADGQIWVPVAGGFATVDPGSGTSGQVREDRPTPTDPDPQDWVVREDGLRRYRAWPEGRIEGQRICRRCKSGWKRIWKLRVAGATPGTPWIRRRLVYFGALDNQVYAVRASNGHRVWASDVGGRVSAGLTGWSGVVDPEDPGGPAEPAADPLQLLFVVPDHGKRLVVLDARTGAQVTTVELADGEGRLTGVPALLDDGRVAVAQQRYRAEEGVLRVYRIVRQAEPAPGETNQDSPEDTTRSTSPARTSAASSQRISRTTPLSGSPDPP